MNTIQKNFKMKSKLRHMADGGAALLGDGMAGQAAQVIAGRQAQLDEQERIAMGGEPAPVPAPTSPVTANKKPQEKSALRSFFGLADGGEILKDTVGGVPTFTDARKGVPTAGAKPYTPGSAGGGTLSVIGMDPAVRAGIEQQNAERAARAAPKPNLETQIGNYLQQKQGVSPLATPAAPAPVLPAKPGFDTASVGKSDIFSPKEIKGFNAIGQQGNEAAQAGMSAGLEALQSGSSAPSAPAFDEQPTQDFFGFAHGGKVKGPGGPTDDKVGPVMLSHGEYVLPADTVKQVGKENLDALRDQTHEFVNEKPRNDGLRGYANGTPSEFDFERPRPGRVSVPGGGVMEVGPNGVARTTALPTNQFPVAQGPVEPTMRISPEQIQRAQAQTNARFGSTAPPAAAAPIAASPAATTTAEAVGDATKVSRLRAGLDATKSFAGNTLRGAARTVGTAAAPALAGLDYYNASPEERQAAGGSEAGFANASGQLGSFLGSNLGFRASSPRDIGGMISAAQGNGSAAYYNTPESQKGWGRKMGEKYLPTESDRILQGGVKLSPQAQARIASGEFKIENGQLVSGDPAKAQAAAAAAGVTTPGDRESMNESMGNLRAGQPAGNGFEASNVPGIQKRGNEYLGVGKPAAQEDPIMSELRSALRGMGGSNNRGGGNFMPASNERDINKRYDKMAKDLSGMYGKAGQGNLARRMLELEDSRTRALSGDTQNQSTLRGQNMTAQNYAATADATARAEAMRALTGMSERQATARAAAGTAAATAADKADAASAASEEKGTADFDKFATDRFGDDQKGREGFKAFVQSADKKDTGNLSSPNANQRREAYEDMYNRWQVAQGINDGQGALMGQESTGYNPIKEMIADPSVADIADGWWNGGMSNLDAVKSVLREFSPADNRLYRDDLGRVTTAQRVEGDDVRRKQVAADMIKDAPRRKALRDQYK